MIAAEFRPGMVCNAVPDRVVLEREIANKTLFAERWDGGLAVFRRRSTHDILSFWLNNLIAPLPFLPERDTVVEIATRPRDVALRESIAFWKKTGFCEILSRVRLTRPAGKCEPPKILIETAKKTDFDEISALLLNSFSALTGCLPEDESLKTIIDNGEILVSRDDNRAVSGLLHFKTGRASMEIRHLAVRTDCRNRGIADQLVRALLIMCGKSVVWTGKENFSAIHIYEKNGFSADQYSSTVLLFEKGRTPND